MVAQPEGRWVVESGEAGQISSVHRTKDEAVGSARELAKVHVPS